MPRHIAKASEQYRIRLVMDATSSSAADSRSYLEAEEWDVADAILSLRGDLKAKAKAFCADPANRTSLAVFQSPETLRELGYI